MVKTEECKIEKYFVDNKIKKSVTLLIFWNKYNNHVLHDPGRKVLFVWNKNLAMKDENIWPEVRFLMSSFHSYKVLKELSID